MTVRTQLVPYIAYVDPGACEAAWNGGYVVSEISPKH